MGEVGKERVGALRRKRAGSGTVSIVVTDVSGIYRRFLASPEGRKAYGAALRKYPGRDEQETKRATREILKGLRKWFIEKAGVEGSWTGAMARGFYNEIKRVG